MKVLVAEDEHKIANSIKKGFEQENIIVDVVYDGKSAYDLAFGEEYDVIVLDLMLPSMTGEQICSELRKERNHTPILMLTAKSTLGDKVAGLNMGADDYLTKPFAFEELLARVGALGRRPRQANGIILKSGNVELDSKNFEVRKNKRTVGLSKKEFQLLEFLMRNKGKIVSKEEIISRVWDYEADILTNTVEVFVRFLRKKLGKDFIKTVRGFGYRV